MRGRVGDYKRRVGDYKRRQQLLPILVQSLLLGICNTDKGQQLLPIVTNK